MKVIKSLSITDIHSAFEPKYKAGFTFNGEQHSFWEFVYVIDGCVGVSADEKVYELKKNEIIFHKPLELHKLWTPAGCTSHLFIASFSAEGEAMKELENSVFSLSHGQKEKLLELIDFLKDELCGEVPEKYPYTENDAEFYREYSIAEGFKKILHQTANYIELFMLSAVSSGRTCSNPLETREALLYHKIIKLLENNVYSRLSVRDIADICCVSVSSVNKTFAKFSSGGIHRCFTRLKIMKAAELLASDTEISQISELLGFSSQNYFSMVFKRETGLSPLNYKRKYLIK